MPRKNSLRARIGELEQELSRIHEEHAKHIKDLTTPAFLDAARERLREAAVSPSPSIMVQNNDVVRVLIRLTQLERNAGKRS